MTPPTPPTLQTICILCATAGLLGTGLGLIDSVRDILSLSRRSAGIAPDRRYALQLVAAQACRQDLVRLLVQSLVTTAVVHAASSTVLALMAAISLTLLVSTLWDYVDRCRLSRRH